jgi:2,4-dienoyl-CoA reductase-like NADH-dependent reductase (Old Yellow Enzyme family)
MSAYPHLFSPLSLGSLSLPNRLLVAPMATNFADARHCATDQLVEYSVARAKGGFGLIVTEHAAVHRMGLTSPRMLGVFDEAHIPGLKRLAEAVHQAGGLIAVQLQHGGRQASEECIGGVCFSPSAIPSGRDRRTPRELTDDEIWEIITAFGDGAARCQEAGMDGVEVHMAHGYLGCSFLSPLLNQRDDRWGGDTERRTRFAREVMQAIRVTCGPDFPVWCRVSAEEFLAGGMTLDEMKQVAPLLEGYGYQALHVSAAIGETAYYASAPYYVDQGHLLPLAEGVKQVVDVPVIGVGNLHDPDVMEQALAEGMCDAVALGRQALADADWPRKAQSGAKRTIIPCTYCGLGCGERSFSAGEVRCTTNPWTGLESKWRDWPDGPPATPRMVLVIGGGPAGMQCAVTAARRGHFVQLWERDERLGGAYYTASLPPGKRLYQSLIAWYEQELQGLGVKVLLGTEGTVASIASAAPEVVVIATGARPLVMSETGILGEGAWAAEDVLRQRPDLTEPVAVVGAGVVGSETAHFLVDLGYRVLLFEQHSELARGVVGPARHFLLEALRERLAGHYTHALVTEARAGRVVASISETRREFTVGSVVLATGRVPDDTLSGALAGPEVHVIGDARKPWHAQAAIHAGAELGRTL